jgi:hypothetical protein
MKRLFLTLSLLLLTTPTYAQSPTIYLPLITKPDTVTQSATWLKVATHSPGWTSWSIIQSQDGSFYATAISAILKSTNGSSWTVNLNTSPLPTDTQTGYILYQLTNGSIFHGSRRGNGSPLIRTDNNGVSWANKSLPEMTVIYNVIQTNSGAVLAGGATSTGAGIWRSTNGGDTWNKVFTGAVETSIQTFAIAGNGTVVAGNSRGFIFRSASDGVAWSAGPFVNNEPANQIVRLSDGNLYLAAGLSYGQRGYLYRSTDNGASWILRYKFEGQGLSHILEITPNKLYAGVIQNQPPGWASILVSPDNGLTWGTEFNGVGTAAQAGGMVLGTDGYTYIGFSNSTVSNTEVWRGR